MKNVSYLAVILATSLSLEGCASMNLFKDDTPAAAPAAIAAPPVGAPNLAPGLQAPGLQAAPGTLTAAQIKTLLTGKSWRWQGPKNGGVTLYASDGTSLVEVTGKGTTQGKWQVQDGQLCEQFAPASFLPQGSPMSCQPFTGGANGVYNVGPATFKLAS